MPSKKSRVAKLVIFLFLITKVASKIEFTNIKCTSLDPEFANFEYCFLKSENRTYKYFSLKVNLYKKPVTKVKINIALLKRYNGYKPFLYNVTVDACRFLKNLNRNPVAVYFDSLYRSHTNMNHTCPYDHDLILEKLSTGFLNNKLTNVLPFPNGDYLFHTNWYAYDIKRATVDVYCTLSGAND